MRGIKAAVANRNQGFAQDCAATGPNFSKAYRFLSKPTSRGVNAAAEDGMKMNKKSRQVSERSRYILINDPDLLRFDSAILNSIEY